MRSYWDDTNANGKPLTDGRKCFVVDSEDPNLPVIRTYGRTEEEVLEKVARTVGTGQAEINRLRSARPATSERTAPAHSAPATLTADEQARATADLSNPAKAPEAIKTLLRGVGFDVDKERFRQDTTRMGNVAQEWERAHPDKLWSDERNMRLLMDTAVLHFRYRQTMSPEAIDSAYQYLLERNMLYEVPEATPAVPPDGSQDSRTVRNATSYRSTSLRATPPAVVRENPKAFLIECDKLNSKQLREKIEHEPGFKEKYEKAMASAAVA